MVTMVTMLSQVTPSWSAEANVRTKNIVFTIDVSVFHSNIILLLRYSEATTLVAHKGGKHKKVKWCSRTTKYECNCKCNC